MSDGNEWDFSPDFSGYEAACLIRGIDPYPVEGKVDQIRPIILRMKNSYYGGVRALINDVLESRSSNSIINGQYVEAMINPLKDRTPKKNHLWSIEIEEMINRYNASYANIGLLDSLEISTNIAEQLSQEDLQLRYKEWNDKFDIDLPKKQRLAAKEMKSWASDETHEFDSQKFSREELSRWLIDNNFSSQYDFIKPVQKVTFEKPSSATTHERNTLLILIGVLCHKLMKNDRNATATLEKIAADLGVKLGDDTIRKKIREAAALVEERQQAAITDGALKLKKMASSLAP